MHRKRSLFLLGGLFAALAIGVAGCGGEEEPTEEGAQAAEQTLRIAVGTEPPSLDPGLATDTTSANVIYTLMDPLVKLEKESLEPEPNLAESWDVEGNVVTYHLRDDAKWSNGDPVTAQDFEFAWKRTLDPKLAADYAYQLYAIEGGADYNGCTPPASKKCQALADKVGVRAVDDHTLEVTLTSPQPWFVAQSAHHSFLPVHRATVEQFGDKWTEPENIVTNGPFQLREWRHEESLTLEKWDDWRNADDVQLERIEMRIIPDAVTALQSYEAGEVDGCFEGSCIPPQEVDRLKETDDYIQLPALGTYYIGVNVKTVPDLNQRRALAFAIDRETIVNQITKMGETPATSFTPQGMPGFDEINPGFLQTTADAATAKEYWDQAASPKTKLNYFHNNAPGHREIAVAVQSMWKEALGVSTTIKQMEWAQYLEFIGPPPHKSVDVYRLGWIADFPDDLNFLEMWTCESGNNNSNFCNKEYDRLVEEARGTEDDAERIEIYRQLEQMLTGEEGDLPFIPIYWYTNADIRRADKVQDWYVSPMGVYDFTGMSISG